MCVPLHAEKVHFWLLIDQRVDRVQIPPPPLYQPLPDLERSPRDACATLFFLLPERTGCMPWLAQLCFDAKQVLLPPVNDTSGYDVLHEVVQQHSSAPYLWRVYYNEKQHEVRCQSVLEFLFC